MLTQFNFVNYLTLLTNAALAPKDLDGVENIFSVEEAAGILKAGFDLYRFSECFRLLLIKLWCPAILLLYLLMLFIEMLLL